MSHNHPVLDTDNLFVIDPLTRVIKAQSSKTSVVQYDHNSERFSFELPRFIEGHDMMTCNKVEVHYLNAGQGKDEKQSGVYEVDDLQEVEGENKVTCSWLISAGATQYAGKLAFLLRFCCLEGEKVTYAWNTAPFERIHVTEGMNASATVVLDYSDILEKWKAELFAAGYINAETMQQDIKTLQKDVGLLSVYVTPQMFGAKGDGVTDDTAAVTTAVSAAHEQGRVLFFPAGAYLVSETVVLDNVQHVVSIGWLVYGGDNVAIQAKGNHDATMQLRVKSLDNRHVGTGIKLVNVYHCNFDLSACGFAVGCEFLGDATGCVYNTITPRYVVSNQVALKLNSANGGWCNQNVFTGGRISKYSSDVFDLTGVLITSECGYYSNSNVFYGVSIEGTALHAIRAEYGQYNRFHEIRNEGCTYTLTEENESMCNTVSVSYGSNDKHNNTGAYIGSSVEPFRNRHLPKYRQVFNCEEVVKKVYHTSNRVTSSVFKIMAYEGALDVVSSGKLDVSGDYIHSEGFPCLALRLDPTAGNRYYVELICKEGYTGRFAIVAYDETGGLFTTQPIKLRAHENMARVDASGLTYFQTQVDGKNSIEFEVIDGNVGELYIFFKGGTDDLYLRGVTVFATGNGRVINDSVPQLNGMPTNPGSYGDMVKSTIDENLVWVMLDQWREITL